MKQRWIFALAGALLLGTLPGCTPKPAPAPAPSVEPYPYTPPTNDVGTAYPDRDYGFQLEPPPEGEDIAVLRTDFGDIAMRLFPEAAPKAVENFVTHAKAGYFDGMEFYDVNSNYVLTGDPLGNGTGGESVWDAPFENEFDKKLLNLAGAVSMANDGREGRNTSPFFFNLPSLGVNEEGQDNNLKNTRALAEQNAEGYRIRWDEAVGEAQSYYAENEPTLKDAGFDDWQAYLRWLHRLAPVADLVPQEVWELYETHGGSIANDGGYRSYGGLPVFAQVFAGMEVLQQIAAVKTAETPANKPLAEVLIRGVEILPYHPGALELKPAAVPADYGKTAAFTPHTVDSVYQSKVYGFQLDAPAKGEEVVRLHTSKGDIRLRLFPEAAPKAVENFLTRVGAGDFDGLDFYRVIDDFMIQSGKPADADAGESIWGEPFADEFDRKLLNLRGALAMANPGAENQNGSEFFINQAPADTVMDREQLLEMEEAYKQQESSQKAQAKIQYLNNRALLKAMYPTFEAYYYANADCPWPESGKVPAEVWELYAQKGGNINLDGAWRVYGGHTVFGQLFEGWEVLDAIAGVEVDENSQPVEAVKILTATVERF